MTAFLVLSIGCKSGDSGDSGDSEVRVVNMKAIPGVLYPVTGCTPVFAINATQYTGEVAWAAADGTVLGESDVFAEGVVYTATITLTAKDGYYTLEGVSADFFTVEKATTVNNAANSGVVTAEFPPAANPVVVIAGAIEGLTAPVMGSAPDTDIDDNAQYTGRVEWTGDLDSGKFKAGTLYIATITLTAKHGYTFTGITGDFTVAGAPEGTIVNFNATTGVVTAEFPKIQATIFHDKIFGVTAPVKDQIPVTAPDTKYEEQFTGAVKWKDADGTALVEGDTFEEGVIYTATITLTPKDGYTFTGVSANFFEVEGADSVTNAAESGVVTAVFPPAPVTVTNLEIEGLTAPVMGSAPDTDIDDDDQYTGTVLWIGQLDDEGNFKAGTSYYAKVTLTAKTGYSFTGVGKDTLIVEGAYSVTNDENSGEVTARFPITVSKAAIKGVTAPVMGAAL